MSDKRKTEITAFLPVYNEEKRLKNVLECFRWCDEVLLLDKESTDDTVKIAKQYSNVTILTKKYTEEYDSNEFDFFLKNCKTEWCMIVTASDLIHPKLAKKMKELIGNCHFEYDIISVPYKPYFLGCCEKCSPWYTEYVNKIFRVSALSLNLDSVHAVLTSTSSRLYQIPFTEPKVAYYHLTHQSAKSVIERNVRYWKGEASSSQSLSSINKIIVRAGIRFVFLRGGLFKGRQALALFYSFLSYFMMAYVCKWEYQYGKIEGTYAILQKEIVDLWNKSQSDESLY